MKTSGIVDLLANDCCFIKLNFVRRLASTFILGIIVGCSFWGTGTRRNTRQVQDVWTHATVAMQCLSTLQCTADVHTFYI